ncbi:MAG: phosphatidylserine decarboxylase, partial [Gemmatimonadaceae bacterium]
MNFAREGYLYIGIATLAAIVAFGLAVARRSWPLWLLAVIVTLLALWVAYFFRDPERTGDRGAQLVVAPADGRLIMMTEVDEPAFVQGRAFRMSIFMNVFNVHVNRYPVDGVVRYVQYNKGKFINAAAEKSSLENEQMSVGIESGQR